MTTQDRLQIAQQIAPLLTPGTWRAVADPNSLSGVQLISGAGEKVHVYEAKQRGALRFDAALGPLHKHVNWRTDPKTEITVSASRPPKAIAGEINRRLLPVARELWCTLAERAAKQAASDDELRANLALLRTSGIVSPHEHGSPESGQVQVYDLIPGGGPYFKATVYAHCVDLELRNLTPELAAAMLGVLAYHEGRKPAPALRAVLMVTPEA